jgi:HSP20 family molecular chaperone IbpA
MTYRFYADASAYPNFFEFINSFVDNATASEGEGRRDCEGGPCGPRGRGGRWGAGPHRGGFQHGRPSHHGAWPHHQGRHGERSPTGDADEPQTIRPQVDIYSTETDYKVYIAIPSADKESISITYDPNNRDLAYSGTTLRPAEFADLDDEALKKVLLKADRKFGQFEGKEKIPASEDGEKIRFEEATAKFENGVLELTLPKIEKEGPKPIVID